MLASFEACLLGVLALVEALLLLEPKLHTHKFPIPEVREGHIARSLLLCNLVALQDLWADGSALEEGLPVCIQLLKGNLRLFILGGLACRRTFTMP